MGYDTLYSPINLWQCSFFFTDRQLQDTLIAQDLFCSRLQGKWKRKFFTKRQSDSSQSLGQDSTSSDAVAPPACPENHEPQTTSTPEAEPVRCGGSLPSLPARPSFPVDMNLHQPLNVGLMEELSSDSEDLEPQDAARLPVINNGASPPWSQPSSSASACAMGVFAPPASCFSHFGNRAGIADGLHPSGQNPMDVEEVDSSSDHDVGDVYLPTLGLQNGVNWPKIDVPGGSLSSDDDGDGEGLASAGVPAPFCPEQLPVDDLALMLEDTQVFPGIEKEQEQQVYLPSLGHVAWPQVDAPRPAAADFVSWDDRLRLPEEESQPFEDSIPDSILTPRNLQWMQAKGYAIPSSLQHLLPTRREPDEESEAGSMVGSPGTCLDSSSEIAFADTLADADIVGDHGLDTPSQLQCLDRDQAWRAVHLVVYHKLYTYIYMCVCAHAHILFFKDLATDLSHVHLQLATCNVVLASDSAVIIFPNCCIPAPKNLPSNHAIPLDAAPEKLLMWCLS